MTDRTQPKDGTMHDVRSPETALDRLLALRPEDLDGWEVELASELDPDLRAAAEEMDAEFDTLLSSWVDAEREIPAPAITARDILDRDARVPSPTEVAPADSNIARIHRTGQDHAGLRRLTAALVAALMLVAVGSWIVALQTPASLDGTSRTKEGVTAESATRLELQFSVERGDQVVPGSLGAPLGLDDHIAMRMDVRGEGGWLSVFEVDGAGEPQLLYPAAGESIRLAAGSHPLVGAQGQPLVYRPDNGMTGPLRYVALLTREPIDPMRVAPGVLSAGTDRADLWPRPVLAASEFTVDWQ
jgi:hypothetical protein